MSFDVYKHLRPGFIRFRVDPQTITEAPPDESRFSTGARGEFRALHARGMVFDEPVTAATGVGSLRARSFVPQSRFERYFRTGESPGSTWITFGLVMLGVLLVILGILVLALKGPQGWVEIVLGAALIAGPYVVAAKRRRDMRVRLERELAAREEEERALRERVGAMTRVLDELQVLPDLAGIEQLEADRRKFDLPWEVYGPLARRAVLRAGFEGVSRSHEVPLDDIGSRIDRLCAAAGLPHEETRSLKQRLCRRLAWHLIADGRMTPVMQRRLQDVAEAMGLRVTDFGSEAAVADELRRANTLTFRTLPRKTGSIDLRFGEVLHHRSSGVWMKVSPVRASIDAEYKLEGESWIPDGRCDLWITSKRIRVTGERDAEIEYPDLMGIEIDADFNVVVISAADRKRVAIELSDPYLSATMIDFASEADRPKLFGLGPLDRHPTM